MSQGVGEIFCLPKTAWPPTYQELVEKALMIEGKQQQIENRKRKYGQGK